MEKRNPWKIHQLRQHTAILDGTAAPSLVLMNATYLHATFKQWRKGHIWIHHDRIVYVGSALPKRQNGTELIDLNGKTVVPGYIEPHVHPFQLYNPHTFSDYASRLGTTTFIQDNLMLLLLCEKKKALPFIQQFSSSPLHHYWWSRIDSQTEMAHEEEVFSYSEMRKWLEDPNVLLAGEITSWPKLLDGDDLLLTWVQEARRQHKRVEAHLPGASEKTIAKMALLGATGDHEAMTGEEAWMRLEQGLAVTLRHSSIRPDLPKLIRELKELGLPSFESIMMTTDGSTPSFYEEGVMDRLISIAIEEGVPPIEAYQMASTAVAKYYRFDHLLGQVATGRFATLNILEDEFSPRPISVLSKGKWILREERAFQTIEQPDWSSLPPLHLSWSLQDEDMQFSMPCGIEMVNNVITKPYSVNLDTSQEELKMDHDESFLMLMDREGQWRMCTMIKGFATNLGALASSFSNTGDILLIGKRKTDMLIAFERMKELHGGIVVVEKGEIVHEIPLKLAGAMSLEPMETVMEQEATLRTVLADRGYVHGDPIYTLLFLSSTHLPYIRITQRGLYDVKKRNVLFPTIMREDVRTRK